MRRRSSDRPALEQVGGNMTTKIPVSLGDRSYDIEIGRGNLARAAAFITERLPRCRQAVVITDENVRSPHAERVLQSLAASGLKSDLLTVPSGEASKCVFEAERL